MNLAVLEARAALICKITWKTVSRMLTIHYRSTGHWFSRLKRKLQNFQNSFHAPREPSAWDYPMRTILFFTKLDIQFCPLSITDHLRQVWLVKCKAQRSNGFASEDAGALGEIKSQTCRGCPRQQASSRGFGMDAKTCIVSLSLSLHKS